MLLFVFFFFLLCILSSVCDYAVLTLNSTWVDDFATDSCGWSPTTMYGDDIHGFWATNDGSVLTRTFELPEESNDYDIVDITVDFSMIAGSSWDTNDYISYSIELDDGSTVFATGITTSINGVGGASSQNGWIVTNNPYTDVSTYSDWLGRYAVTRQFTFDSSLYTSRHMVVKFWYSGGGGEAITNEFWGIDSVAIEVGQGMFFFCHIFATFFVHSQEKTFLLHCQVFFLVFFVIVYFVI